jgi:cobaltochelatase CobN
MTALLGAMQAPGARARVLALAGDPALGGRVAAARAAARVRLGESAASRTDALQAAIAARPWPADDASLARLHDDLGFWQAAQGRLPEPYAAMLAGHADAVAAYAQALAAELARREAQARRRADAVVAVHTQLGAVRAYRERLLDSPRNEWAMLDRALAGGFVPALAGGDPILNPATLPTGHNMYGIDAEKAPSPQAWSVGKRLGDALIARYRQDHGTSPNKVAFTLWAGDFIHTEGASIAEILYLLGVEPTRDPFGRISGLRLIPARELGRPRVDVVVQTSGQLRDLAASRLGLINRAVAMAAAADDGALANPVRAGTEQTERELKREGMAPAAARRYAGVRVFGGVDGAYGTGIMGMVESGDRWRDAAEVAATYIDNMGAAYGDGELWASNQPGLFRAALRRTDAVVQPLSSNTWGPISLDHVYEFAGGMDLAVRQVTGKDPAAYFNDYRNASSASLGEAKEAIAAEARATLLNDAFIARMAQGGASSAERFAETFRNVYGWNVMKPAAVDPALWDALYDTYVRDGGRPGIGAFFEKQNPYALEEMTAVMLETARKGYWAPAPAVLTDLAARHAALIRRFGPSGTGFVNDNQALAHFIAGRLPEAERTAYAGALQRSRYGTALDGGRAIHLEAVGDKARTAPDRAAAAKDAVRPAPRATAAGDAERPRRRWGVLLGCALAALAVVAGIRRIRRRHAQA